MGMRQPLPAALKQRVSTRVKMKTKIFAAALMSALSALLFCSAGCSNRRVEIDTSQFEYAFQNAPANDRNYVRQAMAAIKNGEYDSALTALNKLAENPRLTPQQQESLRELVLQLTEKVRSSAQPRPADTRPVPSSTTEKSDPTNNMR